jgi:ubiquinone/menaquinone biosynthesis C-methylase UbiE
MREQIEQTVTRILARHPQRVQEIGFGTGMLLFRIAPHTTSYLASDVSADALTYVQQVLATRPLPQVRLVQESADEAIRIPPESVDTVLSQHRLSAAGAPGSLGRVAIWWRPLHR